MIKKMKQIKVMNKKEVIFKKVTNNKRVNLCLKEDNKTMSSQVITNRIQIKLKFSRNSNKIKIKIDNQSDNTSI